MACTITNVQVSGQNIDAGGVPTSYELNFQVGECAAVDVEVFDAAGGQLIFRSLGRPVTGPIDPTSHLTRIVLTFTPTQAQRQPCNGTYHVVVTCRDNKECKAEGAITIAC